MIYQSQWPGRCHALNGLYGINVICILLCKVDTLSGVHCLLRYRERNKSIKNKVAGKDYIYCEFYIEMKTPFVRLFVEGAGINLFIILFGHIEANNLIR